METEHEHLCEKCGHVWAHQSPPLGCTKGEHDEAHKCPECGSGPYFMKLPQEVGPDDALIRSTLNLFDKIFGRL